MIDRNMLYFHWTSDRVEQAMYAAGSVNIYHVIKLLKICLIERCI